MKPFFTLLSLLVLLTATNSYAQTTYTVSSNASYSAACTNCTFNIASGATLTISRSGTCANCTFTGGAIAIQEDIVCQPCSFNGNSITTSSQVKPNSGTTSFSHVTMVINNTGSILANTAVNISNSTFTFNNTSYFNNNGGQLSITSSTLYFYDNSYFNANAGPVNLQNSTSIIVGNGSTSSRAYFKMNGPALNIYDNSSSVVMGNLNNAYYNWSAFNSISNSKTYATTYPNVPATMNCGGTGQNACGGYSSPVVYGPATFNYAGVVSNTVLPVLLTDFSVSASGSELVNVSWTTQQESNSAYFAIERSANGSNWQQIGTETAKGNSTMVSNYSYSDRSPLNGVAYYRLKMVNIDGSYMYSDIKVIHATVVKGISFFPNPARDFVNVSLGTSTGEVSIQLINLSGQVMQERKVAEGNTGTVSLSVQQLTPGMYIVKVSGANGYQFSSKLMIAH